MTGMTSGPLRVCIVAGGTGGHLFPGVAVARELSSRGHQVHFVVKKDPKTEQWLFGEKFPMTSFYCEGLPSRPSFRLIRFLFWMGLSTVHAFRFIQRMRPQVVVGMGGYITFPMALAARMRGIPLVLHEQNRMAGLANRVLSRWASAVAVSFPDTRGLFASVPLRRTGLPLRPEILHPELAAEHEELGLQKGRLTFLVFGGSQGAHRLNELVVGTLSALLSMKENIQFIHISGSKDYDFVASSYRTWGYVSHVTAFSRDMGRLYALSDLIIGRAGASSVMEIAAVQKPAILIPFPYATDNHQELNARYLSDRGAALLELERDLTVQRFQSILIDIISQPGRLESYRRELSGITEDFGGAARRFSDFLEEAARAETSITRGRETP